MQEVFTNADFRERKMRARKMPPAKSRKREVSQQKLPFDDAVSFAKEKSFDMLALEALLSLENQIRDHLYLPNARRRDDDDQY
jgi:hypothetical protein